MIFNLWRKYPKRKPKESGYYLCTLTEISSPSMMMLYYKVREDKWIDISRQTVFDGYNVFKVCRAPIEENHVYFDGLCERGDEVIAWKQLPKEYQRRKK